jgi:uncharacterized protein with HEPN domain
MAVDSDEVWNVIEKDLPQLKQAIEAMSEDMEE